MARQGEARKVRKHPWRTSNEEERGKERTKLKQQKKRRSSRIPKRQDPSPATPVRPNGPQWTVKQEQQRVLFPIPKKEREDTTFLPQLGMVTDLVCAGSKSSVA